MKSSIFLAVLIAAFHCQAEGAVPADYKSKIESALAKQHPGYREFVCEYYGPARAVVGNGKKEVDVVCCDWGGKLKSGALPLMSTRQIFVFAGQKLSEAKESEIKWLDENPIPRKKGFNQLAQPTRATVPHR